MLSFHLCLCVPGIIFSSGRPTKLLEELLIHLTLPVRRSLLASRLSSSDDANNRPVDESYKLRRLLRTRKW
jgi:hypothetical protein